MTYFLGRDVDIKITTENTSMGVTVAGAAASGGSAWIMPLGNANGTTLTDIVGIDLSLGAQDKDIVYFGQNTPLKAEIKQENTITLTLNKFNNYWTKIWKNARYGTDGTDCDIGLEIPAAGAFGYRIYVTLKASGDVIALPACVIASRPLTLDAAGVTEEQVEFIGYVQYKEGTAYADVTGSIATSGAAGF